MSRVQCKCTVRADSCSYFIITCRRWQLPSTIACSKHRRRPHVHQSLVCMWDFEKKKKKVWHLHAGEKTERYCCQSNSTKNELISLFFRVWLRSICGLHSCGRFPTGWWAVWAESPTRTVYFSPEICWSSDGICSVVFGHTLSFRMRKEAF